MSGRQLNELGAVTSLLATDFLYLQRGSGAGSSKKITFEDFIESIGVPPGGLLAVNNLSDLEDAEAAIENLGLGSLALQDADNIEITGGSIDGVTISNAAFNSDLEVEGIVTATAFVGNGAGLTGITGATGGVNNTGSTTIGADSDDNGVGIISFQIGGEEKASVDNEGLFNCNLPPTQNFVMEDSDVLPTFTVTEGEEGASVTFFKGNDLSLFLGYQVSPGWDDNKPVKNIGIGWNALEQLSTGTNNIAIGYHVAGRNTTGSQNIAIGYAALYDNVSGSGNVAVGNSTLHCAVGASGSSNVAVGDGCLGVLTTGSGNVAIGSGVLASLTTGNANITLGQSAANALTTASGNVVIGNEAGKRITTGSENVVIGHLAGYPDGGPISGIGNVLLGAKVGFGGASNNWDNTICIGYDMDVTASNRAVIGNVSITDVYFGSETAAAVVHAAAYTTSGSSIFVFGSSPFPIAADKNGKTYVFNGSGAQTLTVPAGLPKGFWCRIIQLGSGSVTLVESSTTIVSKSTLALAGEGSKAELFSYDDDEFVLSGDLA